MCARTDDPVFDERPDEITLEKFKKYFPIELLQGVTLFKFCGNFGDPAIAKDCIAIHEYIDSINPKATFIIHTNGGLRTAKFWTQLGEIYSRNPSRLIIFHFDGLKDTNHIYRADVDWDIAVRNARAAIATGAKCVWGFIPFMHNEHQLEECEQMANDMGFFKFAVKVSARFHHVLKPFRFYDMKTKKYKELYPPTSDEFDVSMLMSDAALPTCVADTRKELYVDAWGNVFPCCWFGAMYTRKDKFREEYERSSLPNLNDRPIEDILRDPMFNGDIEAAWKTKNALSDTCFQKCSGKEMHFWKVDGHTIAQKQVDGKLEEIDFSEIE